MSKLNSVIFIDNLPRLDLHGFDRDTARLYINDFIKENQKLKNEFVLIIHGIGSGIIKDETIKTLSKNKNVVDYKIYPFNVGCTLVQIDLTNIKKVL